MMTAITVTSVLATLCFIVAMVYSFLKRFKVSWTWMGLGFILLASALVMS